MRAREMWIRCYEELGSVSKAARKCGVPRSTLYRWIWRYQTEGKESLNGKSKRPKKLARQKINDQLEAQIQPIRTEFSFGPQRICTHLLRVHNLDISAATIWRVLKKNDVPNIKNTESIMNTPAIVGPFRVIGYRWMSPKSVQSVINLRPLMIVQGCER
ncbi:MAG: helix-turn-helix domain-containing protein [Flavisolibacter sp.]